MLLKCNTHHHLNKHNKHSGLIKHSFITVLVHQVASGTVGDQSPGATDLDSHAFPLGISLSFSSFKSIPKVKNIINKLQAAQIVRFKTYFKKKKKKIFTKVLDEDISLNAIFFLFLQLLFHKICCFCLFFVNLSFQRFFLLSILSRMPILTSVNLACHKHSETTCSAGVVECWGGFHFE